MDYVTLIDQNEETSTTKLEHVMKTFNFPFDSTSENNNDVFDIPNIMKEGRIHDFTQCIQHVLSYNLNTFNNFKIFDTSFIQFFHASQFIIRFLLHWKTELLNENLKFRNQLQELEKLRKDNHSRKLEIRELKKQLLNFLQADDESDGRAIIECILCMKMFVNYSFLYAHHKKRHGDKPLSLDQKESEIRILQKEVQNLKQQLANMNCGMGDTLTANDENSRGKFIKMKLMPEVGCLQAQEKFWRGKLKASCIDFEEEKQYLRNALNELKNENHLLKEQITNTSRRPEVSSAAVQTEELLRDWSRKDDTNPTINPYIPALSHGFKFKFPTEPQELYPTPSIESLNRISSSLTLSDRNLYAEGYVNSDHRDHRAHLVDLDKLKIHSTESFASSTIIDKCESSSYFASPISGPRKSSIDISQENTDSQTTDYYGPRRKTDVVDQVNSFLENYKNRRKKYADIPQLYSPPMISQDTRREEVKKVIAKLFTTDARSEQLADKLIKIYDKRASLVSNDANLSNNDDSPSATHPSATVFHSFSQELQISKIDVEQASFKLENSNSADSAHPLENQNFSSSELEVISNDETEVMSIILSPVKQKSKNLPFLKNIPMKIMKNYTKSRKVCANVLENRIITKLPLPYGRSRILEKTENVQKNHSSHTGMFTDAEFHKSKDSVLSSISESKPKLISAIKKSRSTGNIVKKVAFMDNLPTIRTSSESNLINAAIYSNQRSSQPLNENQAVCTVDGHHQEFKIPVPTPRTRKNITSS